MATTRDPAPSGRLDLVHYFHETSSTHADTSRDVILTPHGATGVLMEVTFEHNNALQPSSPASVERWTIDREKLIELIKANGQRA